MKTSYATSLHYHPHRYFHSCLTTVEGKFYLGRGKENGQTTGALSGADGGR